MDADQSGERLAAIPRPWVSFRFVEQLHRDGAGVWNLLAAIEQELLSEVFAGQGALRLIRQSRRIEDRLTLRQARQDKPEQILQPIAGLGRDGHRLLERKPL